LLGRKTIRFGEQEVVQDANNSRLRLELGVEFPLLVSLFLSLLCSGFEPNVSEDTLNEQRCSLYEVGLYPRRNMGLGSARLFADDVDRCFSGLPER